MAKNFTKEIKQRIFIVQIIFIALFIILGVKSFDVQIFKAKWLAAKAEND